MQNKSHPTPFGSSVIPPGLPGHPLSNGTAPPGVAGTIPGAIGVAGAPRISMVGEKPSAEPSTIAQFVDQFFEQLSDKVADRVVEKLLARFEASVPAMNELLAQQAPAIELTSTRRRARSNTGEIYAELDRAMGDPAPMPMPNGGVPNAAAQTIARAQYVEHEGQIKPAVPSAGALPPEQVEAYSQAHHELAVQLVGIAGVRLVRMPPEPLGFRVGSFPLGVADHVAKDVSEWTAYHASYSNPRHPVEATEGRYEVMRNGVRLAAPDTVMGFGGTWGLTLAQILEAVRFDVAGNFSEFENMK